VIHSWLPVKLALFLFLVPGTVLVSVPWIILSDPGFPGIPLFSPVSVLSFLAWITGVSVLLVCAWDFAVHGKGTPAPFDPPGVLVVRRLYRYTRNPMYLGVIIALFAEAALFSSLRLLLYALAVFLCFHFFVLLYEEKHLLKKFGADYERYRRATPRWGISLTPFH
jgi:protein-S-isoprenylcysteine O-methyltransferase Ste14